MTSCGRPYVVFPAAVRSATLALFLGIVLSLTVLDTAHGYRDLEDVTVKEGGKARFLCQTSIHPRHVSGKNFRDRVTVHWTFNGRRLDLDPEEDSGSEEDEEEEEVAEYSSMEKKHYIFKSYQNRHVLLINKARKEDEGEYSCVTTLGDKVDMASGILTVQRPPDPPRNARVINCHGNTAKVSWEPGNENGAKITSYTVQFNLLDKPDDWYDFYESAAGDEREQNVELSPYGTYSFRVVAKNSVGYGRPSVVTREQCNTPPDRPDRNPRNVRTRTDKKGFLVIEWEPLHRLSFHGPGFRYFVLWRLKGSFAWNSATVNGTYATRFEQEVSEVYGLYEFKVKSANDMGGAHQPAFIYLGRSFEAEPQVTVAGFGLDKNRPLTQTAAHFVWEAIDPKDRKINGKFRGYKILYWEVTDERHKREVYVPVSGQPVAAGHLVKASVPDLPAYSSIRVQVVVVNTHYQGPPSDVEDVFTPEGTPSAVEGLFADVVTHNSVTLRWLPPDHSNGIITGYDIGYQPVLGNRLGPVRPVLRRSNNPRVFQERIEGLKSNHRYRFHIMATTRAGRGQQSFIDVKTDNYTGKPGERGPTIQRPYNDNPMENDDDSNSALSPLSSPLLYSLPALTLTLYSTLLPVFQVVCCS